ncbi:helix-turn-helix domain-containing protein [Halobacterium zhouii]|uniref:helix-turn-helix domain-containing protein n=1 Tax=Halobacterium zhouii TaxID=2902624 RepID=UPI001E370EF0|nr:helix-turn-helix domain-containing protein [Halobacterium zhouii]
MSDDASSKPIEAEFREYALGTLPNQEHRDVHPIVGMIPNKDVRHYVMFQAEAYDADAPMFDGRDMPDSFWDTELAREIKRKYGTDTGTDALLSGNMGQLNYFSGLVSYQKDVSGMQTLMSLQKLIEDIPVFISYIYGIMGAGKTDFAFLLLEVFASIYGRENVCMAANLTSDDLDEEIDHYSRIVEILDSRRERMQAGEDLDEFIMVVDEAAQIFTGSGSDQHKAKALAKLLKLARKANANLILIGQDGKDIGPSLRALCTAFIHKESEKKTTFYRDVKNRQGMGEMMTLSGIPPTNYDDYSTWDEGEFIFDADGDDDEDLVTQEELDELIKEHEREMMALLDATTELTQAAIAEKYGVKSRTVRRAKQRYEDELEDLGLS